VRDRRILAKGTVSMVPKRITAKLDISRRTPKICHKTGQTVLMELRDLRLSIAASKD